MEDKSVQVTMLRTLSAVLFAMALGMAAARIFGWLDISAVLIVSLLTIGIANMTIAHSIANNAGDAE